MKNSINISVVDYSENSVAFFGETKEHKDYLKEIGCRFNGRLRSPEDQESKVPGWILKRSLFNTLINRLHTDGFDIKVEGVEFGVEEAKEVVKEVLSGQVSNNTPKESSSPSEPVNDINMLLMEQMKQMQSLMLEMKRELDEVKSGKQVTEPKKKLSIEEQVKELVGEYTRFEGDKKLLFEITGYSGFDDYPVKTYFIKVVDGKHEVVNSNRSIESIQKMFDNGELEKQSDLPRSTENKEKVVVKKKPVAKRKPATRKKKETVDISTMEAVPVTINKTK